MSESLFLAQQKRIAKYSIFNMKRLAKGSESTAAPNLNPNLNPNWGSAAPPIQYVWGQDVDRFLGLGLGLGLCQDVDRFIKLGNFASTT